MRLRTTGADRIRIGGIVAFGRLFAHFYFNQQIENCVGHNGYERLNLRWKKAENMKSNQLSKSFTKKKEEKKNPT